MSKFTCKPVYLDETQLVREFVESIDGNTPEKILFSTGEHELKERRFFLRHHFIANTIMKGAKVESVFFYEKSLMVIVNQGGRIYQIDACYDPDTNDGEDGFQITFCEYLPDKPLRDGD